MTDIPYCCSTWRNGLVQRQASGPWSRVYTGPT